MKMDLKSAALALCVVASLNAHAAKPVRTPAPPMTQQGYEAAKAKIADGFRADQKLCATVKGPAQDVCQVEAKGRQKSLLADLDAQYKPSAEASFKAKNVTADANYDVARKKCETRKGDAKDRCVKEAKASREAAVRQAKVEKVQETGGAFRGAKARTAVKDS
jgi:hypothetical protein